MHNADGVVQGQLDTPLDDVGTAQAQELGRAFAGTEPALVVSSDLARARATATAIADATGQELRLEPALREVNLGTWQGLTLDEARERHPDEWARWRAGEDVARGGGETYQQAGERAARCLRAVLERVPSSGLVVAVTHGATGRAALGVLLDLPPPFWGRFRGLDNARWSHLVEDGRGWRLAAHNVPATAPFAVAG